jgi:hypothetical protein
VRQQVVGDVAALGAQLGDGLGVVLRRPGDHRVGQDGQAPRLLGLLGQVRLGDGRRGAGRGLTGYFESETRRRPASPTLGIRRVNRAWIWGALIATSLAGWLHQLTAIPDPGGGGLLGWGIRDGKAMIATLRHRLITVPGRLVRHAGRLILRLPPGQQLLTEVLTRLRALPAVS